MREGLASHYLRSSPRKWGPIFQNRGYGSPLTRGRQRSEGSSRFDVGDPIKAWLRLLDELAEARPFFAELGRMVSSLELLAIGPLDVVDDVAAVLAAVQRDRYEARLSRHETGALGHQLQHLGLVVRRNLDGRDLGHDVGVFANFRHVRSPDCSWRQRTRRSEVSPR